MRSARSLLPVTLMVHLPKKQCTSAVKRCARAKRKDTDTCEFDGPPAKKQCTSAVKQCAPKTSIPQSAVVTKHRVWSFKYHSVDEEWQLTACKTLDLDFKKANKIGPGSADLPLTHPNMRTIKKNKA